MGIPHFEQVMQKYEESGKCLARWAKFFFFKSLDISDDRKFLLKRNVLSPSWIPHMPYSLRPVRFGPGVTETPSKYSVEETLACVKSFPPRIQIRPSERLITLQWEKRRIKILIN